MYLKSLELHGFKSFPNRTVLTFERGATVIVGPNGSGKSNISDAMRWVLGELSSRNIRGTKMEDVIFGGTDDRRPMGFAEVSVTFDNTDPINRLDSDFDEVTVTRRYYRTGESEYLINKEAKRLKDIHMLFMNTGVGREGYSIIGQGKVAEIISKKSDDRRTIFEEAAGISKYRHRKEEAERKLKSTSENLERVNDIRLELEGRVGPLEKEAEKARRGLAIYEEKKRADVSLWLFDTKKIHDDILEAEKTWKLSVHELEIVQQSLSDLEAQSENLYNKTQSNKLKSAQLLEKIQKSTEDLHSLDSSLRAAESDFEHSLDLIRECHLRINDIERSETNLQSTMAGYEEKKAGVEKIISELSDTRFSYLEKQQALTEQINKINRELEEALDDLRGEENTATDLKVRIDVLKTSTETDGSKSKDIESEIARYESEGEALKAEADRCEDKASGFRNSIAEKEAILAEAGEKVSALTEEKAQITETLGELKVQKETLDQRADVLARMAEHFDGYLESVKFVMREYGAGRISNSGKIYGPLSSLINVDKKYITAIDTALGVSLQNIVVEHEGTAKAAMSALKRANAGRVTFYPVSVIKKPNESDEIRTAKTLEGFVGRADTLVETDARYRSIIEFLLLRTLVFDNIDNASAAAKRIGYRVKMVTLDGQVINAGGSFTGGSTKKDSGILSRSSEIAALKERGEALGKRIAETAEALSEIDSELKEAQEIYREAEQERELLLTLSRSEFQALDNANAKYEANRNILAVFKQDFENLVSGRARAEEEITRLSAEYKAALERIESFKEFRAKRATELGIIDENRDEVMSHANDVYVKIAEARRDVDGINQLIESVNTRLSDLADEKNAQNERIASLNQKRSGIDAIKAEHKSEYESLEKQIALLMEERREVESGSDEFERELMNIRQNIKDKTSSQQTLMEYSLRNEHRLTQLSEKADKLGSQLQEEYELSYEDAVALNYPPVTEENRDEIGAVQASCRAKLRAIGNYNPGAIEEYADVKSRYDYLNSQYIDLTKSQEELVEIISRIEQEMRSSFTEAFNAINKNFGITFKELFGGGNAELSMTEPEDVLTSGIEIKAAPPGKIIKSMSLLSGGEQSFVAIALLFAILKVNPTPFCILDEIEAALDEVNVFRFGEYVKRLGEDTQFILITHRRGTMEIGDRLYGVTMPQRGISQAIELNVNEIEGKQKELLDGVL
ncbi:MAG: chromosome segregation protein SMC [Clostridia bacterium]|nr:chromosome segregation protein SMC [Clostridia bacterium]